jgi:hypothetical protein
LSSVSGAALRTAALCVLRAPLAVSVRATGPVFRHTARPDDIGTGRRRSPMLASAAPIRQGDGIDRCRVTAYATECLTTRLCAQRGLPAAPASAEQPYCRTQSARVNPQRARSGACGAGGGASTAGARLTVGRGQPASTHCKCTVCDFGGRAPATTRPSRPRSAGPSSSCSPMRVLRARRRGSQL